MGPGREQNHRQIGVSRAQCTKQGHTLFARGGVCCKVHVLDHQINTALRQNFQPLLRACGHDGADVMQRQQDLEGDTHCGVVVDNENCRCGLKNVSGHGRRIPQAARYTTTL
jgi:hypothetical protein